MDKTKLYVKDSVLDYAQKAENQSSSEWLQDYLERKLPNKSPDAIKEISGEILETLDLMEQNKAELAAAQAAGKSAEQWLEAEIMQDEGGNGEKALEAAEFLNGITQAQAELDGVTDVEVIDTADVTEWQDDNWNDYKLKDTVKSVAKEAGQCAFREIASDVVQKVSEEGVSAVLDKEVIGSVLVDGAEAGLKVAVSAGLAVAEESGVIPSVSFRVLATIAHRTVESLSAFKDVVKGKKTITEALIHIKDTAVSTARGLWKMHGNSIKAEIVDAVGNVFGHKGAAITAGVLGLFEGGSIGSRIKNAVKEAGKAAVCFAATKLPLPRFLKNKIMQLS